MAAELEVITAAVTGAIVGGGVKTAMAPFDAAANVVRERVEARLRRTIEKAEGKRGGPLRPANERAAIKALTEAAFTDDQFVHEYLAGVLAGASGQDDGVHVTALIGRMSPLQLGLHCVLYRAFFDVSPRWAAPWSETPLIFVPYEEFERVLPPTRSLNELVGGAAEQLIREDLLGDRDTRGRWLPHGAQSRGLAIFYSLPASSLNVNDRERPRLASLPGATEGIAFWASPFGAEVYAWACGEPDSMRPRANLDPEVPPCAGYLAGGLAADAP